MGGRHHGENNGNWRGGKVENICEDCGNIFLTFPSQQRRYCSSMCQGRKQECICEVCGITFYRHRSKIAKGEGRFCSRGCMGQWRSENCTGENGANWRGGCTISIGCVQCGAVFETTKSKRRNGRGKFCSRDCYMAWFSEHVCGENHPNWHGGKKGYPSGWVRYLREKIRRRDGRMCAVCGMSEADNERLLDVHHIDYDRTNLDESNLISLCQPCHARTGGSRDFWQNNLAELVATAEMTA